MNSANTKIIVGLSGGVDSSVAAFLLLKKGFNVEALFMKNWDEDDDDQYCNAAEDLADAQQIAKKLALNSTLLTFLMNIGRMFLNTFFPNTRKEELRTQMFYVTKE